MSEISLTRIVNLVAELKRKIEKHRDKLIKNEMLVRYILVDPFLRALGWDLENPEQVEPEYTVEGGRVDYALKLAGRVAAFIEAKPLYGITDDVIKEKLKYSVDAGIRYTIITDGNTWRMFDAYKEVPWKEKEICKWSIAEDDAVAVAFNSLIIANTPAFGKIPFLEKRPEAPPVAPVVRAAKIKGPIDSKKAKYLVLKVLAESEKPMGRKEIVEKTRELVELTSKDLEKMRSGRERWEARIRRTVASLRKKGYLERLDRNQYTIVEKGKSYLKDLEKEL